MERSERMGTVRRQLLSGMWLPLVVLGGAAWIGCSSDGLQEVDEEIAFAEPVLDLGRVIAGRPALGHAELVNRGRLRVEAAGTASEMGVRFRPATLALDPGERRLIEVEVTAGLREVLAGEVRFASKGGAEARLDVRAEGAFPLGALPEAIDFGAVPVGRKTHALLPVASEVDEALAVAIEVAGGPEFSTSSPFLALGSRQTGEIALEFVPSDGGDREGVLTVVPCEGCSSSSISLRGRGLRRAIVAEPPSVDFGDLRIGEDPGQAAIRLRNDGDLGLRLEARLDSPSFAFDPGKVAEDLAPGAVIELPVEARTDVAGAHQGNLVVGDRDGGDLLSIPLAARVVPWVSWEPAALDFGTQPPGRSVTKRVRLQAVGPSTTSLLWVKLTRNDVPYRVGGPAAPAPIGPEPIDIDVTFEPLDEGLYQTALVIELSDPAQPRIQIPIQGAAKLTTCALEVLPKSLPGPSIMGLGMLRSYTLHHRKLWLVNRGLGDCLIWDMENRHSTSLPVRPSLPYLLRPGEAASVPVYAWTEDLLAPPKTLPRACNPAGECVVAVTARVDVYHSSLDTPRFVFGYSAGAYPGLVVADPGFVEFDRVRRGDRATQVVRLSGPEDPANRWGGRSRLVLSSDSSPAFGLEPFVAPDVGESLDGFSFEVVFAPQEPGLHAGSVELQTAFVDKPLRILLFGVAE